MPSTPAPLEAPRPGSLRATFEESAMPLWPDNDPRWQTMNELYCHLWALDADQFGEQSAFKEAGRALLTLIADLEGAFDISGSGTDQFQDFVNCRNAVGTIFRHLDALLEGVR